MKIKDILRLIRKHIVLLIAIPVLLGASVAFLTENTYTSKTTLYTGMTSGTNVQLDQSFNVFTSNAAFDNLINIVQSRETSKEVALRLLAQHLMMNRYDPKYISRESFLKMRKMIPPVVNQLVVKQAPRVSPADLQKAQAADSSLNDPSFSVSDLNSMNVLDLQPPVINRDAYELTVRKLENFMGRSDTNFIYRLLNGSDPHYSIKAVSSVSVQRISNSDLIEMKYSSDDPGISQQTLVLITEVCMKNYRIIKESRTDAVVTYFEDKLKQASLKLNLAEDRLLKFNEENKILNYEDQTRDAAKAKQNLEAALQAKRNKLVSDDAAMRSIEEKLSKKQQLQVKNSSLIEKRNRLAYLNAKIATAETMSLPDTSGGQSLAGLKQQAAQLNEEISAEVSEIYGAGNGNETASETNLVDNWIASKRTYEETKAGVSDLERRIKDSQKQFASYAPAGVLLKRIERDIAIAEQEYLEVLRGLNLAKLKVQDIELSSNIKAVDPPFYPVTPNPTKKLMLIIFAALFGFTIVLGAILALEYFDATLKNPQKAAKILNLTPAGIFPKMSPKEGTINFPVITSRLLEMIIQQIELYPEGRPFLNGPRSILFFSTLGKEGKTTLLNSLAQKLKQQGKKVIVVSFSGESFIQTEVSLGESLNTLPPVPEPELIESEISSPVAGQNTPDPDNGIEEKETAAEGHLMVKVDQDYYSIRNYRDLLDRNDFSSSIVPDYVLVEVPAVLSHPYPAGLVASSDLAIMVCRSNRSWSEADQGALDTFRKLTRVNPLFLLNGVDLPVVKSAIGEIPRKPSRFRRRMEKAEQF